MRRDHKLLHSRSNTLVLAECNPDPKFLPTTDGNVETYASNIENVKESESEEQSLSYEEQEQPRKILDWNSKNQKQCEFCRAIL